MTIVKGGLMNLTVRGIRYNPSDATREFLDKKLQKLQFAEGYIHDLDIAITREPVGRVSFGCKTSLFLGYRQDGHL